MTSETLRNSTNQQIGLSTQGTFYSKKKTQNKQKKTKKKPKNHKTTPKPVKELKDLPECILCKKCSRMLWVIAFLNHFLLALDNPWRKTDMSNTSIFPNVDVSLISN